MRRLEIITLTILGLFVIMFRMFHVILVDPLVMRGHRRT
jgi:hypothetical protein